MRESREILRVGRPLSRGARWLGCPRRDRRLGPGSFDLESMAIPFGGLCEGYGVLPAESIDANNAEAAISYFSELIAALERSG